MKSLKELYIDIFNSIDFERIKDHPNILIAANFWEEERYAAAKTCYRFMRAIDDLIDDHKALKVNISDEQKALFLKDVDRWLRMIADGNDDTPFQKELTETIRKFSIPSWPLEAFAKSMIYDINNEGFRTIDSFIDYSSGASVAPAAIFVHLAGVRRTAEGFDAPLFEVRDASKPCALFSYLVHIIRDFQKDQLNNLNYFADDIVSRNGLTAGDLSDIARGAPVTEGFRGIVADYLSLAVRYRKNTEACIRRIWPFLEPRYQLSLEIIFDLYQMVFERIDVQNGTFTTAELNPSPEETRERVLKVILNSKTIDNKLI